MSPLASRTSKTPGTLTLNRLQVRASAAADDATGGTPVTVSLADGDGPAGTATAIAVTYTWSVPKVNRPDLENEDHWIAAGGVVSGDGNATYAPVSSNAGKVLRVVATYTDGSGTDNDKAYARMAHAVAAPRTANNVPQIPVGTPTSFTVAEHAAVGTVIGTVRGADTDTNDILTHELGGDDASLFKIDQATGQITVGAKLDFETATDRDGAADGTQYGFTVTVRDPSGAVPADDGGRGITAGAITITVTVTDQNDAPGQATPGQTTVTERQPKAVDGTTYTVDENHAVKDVAEDDTTTEIELRTAVVIATFAVSDSPPTDAGRRNFYY